jgi:hypothetical protein
MRGTRSTAAALAIAVVLLAACSSSPPHDAPATTAASTTPPTTARATAARIDWSRLRNPIISSPDHAVKDPALVAVRNTWFALFSAVDAHRTWRVGIEHSTDLRTWSAMTTLPHDPKIEGEASPDVVRAPDGRYVVTYQSLRHDVNGGLSKLYYVTTTDFARFSAPKRLGNPLHDAPGDRMIDPALAWTPAGLLLGFKSGALDSTLAFEIARSPSGSLDGPWQLVGRPDIRVFGDTIENDQFIRIDGKWKIVATSNQLDRPFVFDLEGDAGKPVGWLHWSPGRQLSVPHEAWNPGSGITGATFEHANSAYLVDRRAADGHFYLVYEDAPEMTSYDDQGHGALGVARSTDLVHWSVPPH